MMTRLAVEDIELKVLVDALAMRYGYDFRGYSESSLKRRMQAVLTKLGLDTFSELQQKLLHDSELFTSLLSDLTITTSEMFRDPSFFKALREHVIPFLKTFPVFRIWHAGCGGGEEVYSLAIILAEEGILDRAVIYATDINPDALARAKAGIYPIDRVAPYTGSYQKSGGTQDFSRYYTAAYGSIRFENYLKQHILFSEHNLVTDEVFAEMQLILCRNVLIYFSRDLQHRVIDLFTRSLGNRGYLCLGSKETLRTLKQFEFYEELPGNQKIFRKKSIHLTSNTAEEAP
jgi:chemotaxis protein methyltransferase CheR